MDTVNDINRLWSLLPHMDGSVIRWFAKNEAGRTVGDFAVSPRDLELASKALNHFNFYITPNPCTKKIGIRHATEDVSHWSWFFLDLDPIEKDLSKCNPRQALEEYIESFYILVGKDPSTNRPLIIDSGRGCQAWFRLDDRELDEESRFKARRTMKYWLTLLRQSRGDIYGCRLDPSCSDLPRPMRCPGTINLKTGRRTSLIESGTLTRGLAQMMLNATPETEFVNQTVDALPEGMAWQFVMHTLTNKAKKFIEDGWPEGGRHEVAWHTARVCKERGLSKVETHKALLEGSLHCDEPLEDSFILRVLDTEFGP